MLLLFNEDDWCLDNVVRLNENFEIGFFLFCSDYQIRTEVSDISEQTLQLYK